MLTLVLAIAAVIFGAVAIIEAQGRSWAGWGVLCLAAIELLGRFG